MNDERRAEADRIAEAAIDFAIAYGVPEVRVWLGWEGDESVVITATNDKDVRAKIEVNHL